MGNMKISISAELVPQYRTLSKKLRGKKEFRKKLRGKITEAGKPVVDDVRVAVRALKVTSHGGGTAQRRRHNVARATTERAKRSAERRGAGLRDCVAAATGLQVTAKGIRIVVRSARLPPDQESLPRHLDSDKGWRHPTFGRRGEGDWVLQKGGPYFASTIMKRAPRFRQAVQDAMDELAKELDS